MTKQETTKQKWYIGGLHFECSQCGNCCAGPDEGFIWISKHETEMLADHLELTLDQLRQRFLRREGNRTTIIEEPISKDCVFLTKIAGQRGCCAYPARPNQCRTWPFWTSNLQSPADWNMAATICPGINRGKLYTFEDIEKRRKQKKWW